jgi:hypothetical protein
MGEYAGESPAKKVARVRLYKRAAMLLKAAKVEIEKMRALVLAGPEACEAGALLHILGVKEENIVAVDRDPASCAAMKARVPKATVICGDLADSKIWCRVRDANRPDAMGEPYVGFTHLDLMGNLTTNVEVLYGLYALLCPLGGVFATTYLRGRERSYGKALLAGLDAQIKEDGNFRWATGRNARAFRTITALDPKRIYAHLGLINVSLIDATVHVMAPHLTKQKDENFAEFLATYPYVFVPVAAYSYNGEASPMGVVMGQLLKRGSAAEEPLVWNQIAQKSRFSSSYIQRDSILDVLTEADILVAEYGREVACEILSISSGTLAALKAHRTMGTYERN